MAVKNRYSLLETLTLEQIDALILEEKLKEKGYNFWYAIDHFDIGKYCFPVGLDTLDSEYTLEYLSDQFVAYLDFFDRNSNFFLLDQYKDEFNGLYWNITVALHKRIQFVKTDTTFSEYLNSDRDFNLKNDFGLLISVASGVLQKGTSRFNSLVQNKKLIILEEDLDASFEDPKTLRQFKTAFASSKTARLDRVDALKKEYKNKGRSNSENVETDCIAIDRICQINEYFIKKGKKKVLLFLSSTATSRETYFNGDVINYPIILGENLEFHRTSAQLFLQLLLKEEDKIEQLNLIKGIIFKRDNSDEIESENLEEKFQERVRKLRNRFAHEKLLKDFEHYDSLFNRLDASDFSRHKLNSLYKDCQDDFRVRGYGEIDEYARELLDNMDFEYEFRRHFVTWMKAAQRDNGKFQFTVQRGLDHVFATGHHLPLLFVNGGDLKELISAITTQYIKDEVYIIENKIKKSASIIKDFILKKVDRIYEEWKGLWTEPEEVLIRCLLYLIIPVDRRSDEQIEMLTPESVILNLIEKEFEDLKSIGKKEDLISDYYYLILWVNRRAKRYKKAILIGEEAQQKFPKDPRFPHGLSLTYYCKFRDLVPNNSLDILKSDSISHALKIAIVKGEDAIELYLSWNDYSQQIVFRKNRAALKIGLVLLHSYSYHYDNKEYNVIRGRKLLDEVKMEEKEENYERQPEYRYVESILEYQEYVYYKSIGDLRLARKKLTESKHAIKKSVDRIPNREQYIEWADFIGKITFG